MLRTVKLPVHDLNPHLTCALCGGYYIDATTIIECLHSFCKSCIVRYLESSKFCPICDVQVHKNRPMENIRPDETLQDLVYKLVPGLFTREMKKRRDFYSANPAIPSTSGVSTDSGSDGKSDKSNTSNNNNTEEDKISISIEFSPDGLPLHYGKRKRNREQATEPHLQKRYLLCPAAFTIGLLKKFIRMKLDLESKYEIDVFHRQETLSDNYTLMDIAYIYTWRKGGPFRLFYAVYEPGVAPPPKRIKQEATCKEEVAVKQEPGLDAKCGKKSGRSGAPKAKGGGRKRSKPKASDEEKPSKTASSKKKGKSSVRQTVSYLLKCSGKKNEQPSPALSSTQNMDDASQQRIDANVTTLPISLPLSCTIINKPVDVSDTTSKQCVAQGRSKPPPVKKPSAASKVRSKADVSQKTDSLPKGVTGPSGTVIKAPTVKAPKAGQVASKTALGVAKPAKVASAGRKSTSQQGIPPVSQPGVDSVPKTNNAAVTTGVEVAAPPQLEPIVAKQSSKKQKKPPVEKKPRETVPKIKISTLMQGKTGCLKATISNTPSSDVSNTPSSDASSSLTTREEHSQQKKSDKTDKPEVDKNAKPLTDDVPRDNAEKTTGKDTRVKNLVPTTEGNQTAKIVASKEKHNNKSGKAQSLNKTPSLNKGAAEPKGKPPSVNKSAGEPKGKPPSLNKSAGEPKGKPPSLNNSTAEPKGKPPSLNKSAGEPKGKPPSVNKSAPVPKGKPPSLNKSAPEPKGKTPPLNKSAAEPKGKTPPLNKSSVEPKGKPPSLNKSAAEPKGKTPSLNKSAAEPKVKSPSVNKGAGEPKAKTPSLNKTLSLNKSGGEPKGKTPSLSSEPATGLTQVPPKDGQSKKNDQRQTSSQSDSARKEEPKKKMNDQKHKMSSQNDDRSQEPQIKKLKEQTPRLSSKDENQNKAGQDEPEEPKQTTSSLKSNALGKDQQCKRTTEEPQKKQPPSKTASKERCKPDKVQKPDVVPQKTDVQKAAAPSPGASNKTAKDCNRSSAIHLKRPPPPQEKTKPTKSPAEFDTSQDDKNLPLKEKESTGSASDSVALTGSATDSVALANGASKTGLTKQGDQVAVPQQVFPDTKNSSKDSGTMKSTKSSDPKPTLVNGLTESGVQKGKTSSQSASGVDSGKTLAVQKDVDVTKKLPPTNGDVTTSTSNDSGHNSVRSQKDSSDCLGVAAKNKLETVDKAVHNSSEENVSTTKGGLPNGTAKVDPKTQQPTT